MSSIFIGGLSQETSSEALVQYFSQLCTVLEVNLPLKNKTGRSKGFAFLLVDASPADLKKLLSCRHEVCGKTVDVQLPLSFQEKYEIVRKAQENKIFIGRFPKGTNLDDFVNFLSGYGTVVNCGWANPKSNRKMLVHAEMEDPAVCTRIAETGLVFQGTTLTVSLYRSKMTWQSEQLFLEPINRPGWKVCAESARLHKSRIKGLATQQAVKRSKRLNESPPNYGFRLSMVPVVYSGKQARHQPPQIPCAVLGQSQRQDLSIAQYQAGRTINQGIVVSAAGHTHRLSSGALGLPVPQEAVVMGDPRLAWREEPNCSPRSSWDTSGATQFDSSPKSVFWGDQLYLTQVLTNGLGRKGLGSSRLPTHNPDSLQPHSSQAGSRVQPMDFLQKVAYVLF